MLAAFNMNIKPMLCGVTNEIPRGKQWVYQIKLDGIRGIISKRGDSVAIMSRNGIDMTKRFASVVKAVSKLPGDFILDGELVSLQDGVPSFRKLQSSKDVLFYAFDILEVNSRPVVQLPLSMRHEILRSALKGCSDPVRFLDFLSGNIDALCCELEKMGFEGVVAKRLDSEYISERSADWVKIKFVLQQEFVIAGFTDPSGSRIGFGSVLLGYFDGGSFVYAGKVSAGISEKENAKLLNRFAEIRTSGEPFSESSGIRARWVEPKIVCQVRFSEWTENKRLRHPVFLGVRNDKHPEGVTSDL